MGQLIKLRGARLVSEELVETLKRLTVRAQSGELTGMMYVASCCKGEESGICGAFQDDLDYAAEAAATGFNCLLGHKVCLESSDRLPRYMRKEYSHEELYCAVTACGGRR